MFGIGKLPLGPEMQCYALHHRGLGGTGLYKSAAGATTAVTKSLPLLSASLFLCVAGCGNSGASWNSSWDVSADEHRILYTKGQTIWAHDLKGGRDLKVAEGTDPTFVDGAKEILYSSADGSLWLLKFESSLQVRITSPKKGEKDEQPAYDPAGRRVYFAKLSEPGSGGRLWAWDIYSCKLDGSNLVRCTSENFWSLRLSSQPFGLDRLWFEAEKARPTIGDEELVSMSIKPPYSLAYSKLPNGMAPAISHDGTRLVVAEGGAGAYYIETYEFPRMRMLDRSANLGLADHALFFGRTHEVCFLKEDDEGLSGYEIKENGSTEVLFNRKR